MIYGKIAVLLRKDSLAVKINGSGYKIPLLPHVDYLTP